MKIWATEIYRYQGDEDQERNPMGYVSNKGVLGRVGFVEKKRT
jgi:hypothetical protein